MKQCRQSEAEYESQYCHEYLHCSDSFPVSRPLSISCTIPLLCKLTAKIYGFDMTMDSSIKSRIVSLSKNVLQGCYYIAECSLFTKET